MSKKENSLTLSADALNEIKEQMLPVDDTEVMANFSKRSDPTCLSMQDASVQLRMAMCFDSVEL